MSTTTHPRPLTRATAPGRKRLAILTIAALGAAACSASDDAAEPAPQASDTTVTPDSGPAATDDQTSATAATDPPSTDAPTTSAPTTEPVATDPPATSAPEPGNDQTPSCPSADSGAADRSAGVVATFDREALEIPGGVATDRFGNAYVSFGPLGQIGRFAPDSSDYEIVATVPGWDLAPEDYFVEEYGMLGMVVDPDGNIYASVDSETLGGVWRFDCETGDSERLPGTETMRGANKLTFDDDGNLYVTVSWSGDDDAGTPLGSIWKIAPDGAAGEWLESTELGGTGAFSLPVPIGANGIGFADGRLYVNVSEKTSILTVEVLDDGSAGPVEPLVRSAFDFINGGLALDPQGRIFITDINVQGVSLIEPDGTATEIIGGVDDGFNSVLDLAFVVDDTDPTLYVVTDAGAGGVGPGGPAPALIAVDVD